MSFEVVFAPAARDDLRRLYRHLLDRADTIEDLDLAERALDAIDTAVTVHLAKTPFIFRKAAGNHSLRRELVIPFGSTGYVALYEIAGPARVVVLAVRHQRQEDFGG